MAETEKRWMIRLDENEERVRDADPRYFEAKEIEVVPASSLEEARQERDDAKGDALQAALRCKELEEALTRIAEAPRPSSSSQQLRHQQIAEGWLKARETARKALQGQEGR